MANEEDINKLRGMLSGLADIIRESDGTSEPIKGSELLHRLADATTIWHDVEDSSEGLVYNGYIGNNYVRVDQDYSSALDYFEKLLNVFKQKITSDSGKKYSIDGLKAAEESTVGFHKTYTFAERSVFPFPDGVNILAADAHNNYKETLVHAKEYYFLPDSVHTLKTSSLIGAGIVYIPRSVHTIESDIFKDVSGRYYDGGKAIVFDYGVQWSGISHEWAADPAIVANAFTQGASRPVKDGDYLYSTSGPYESSAIKFALILDAKGATAEQPEITVPEYLGGYRVSMIWSNAFYNNDYLTHITLPETVTIIGPCAFRDCDKLAEVTFTTANGVRNTGISISNGAFALTDWHSVYLPSIDNSGQSEKRYHYIEDLAYGAPNSPIYVFDQTHATLPTIERWNSDEDGILNISQTHLNNVTLWLESDDDLETTINLSDVKLDGRAREPSLDRFTLNPLFDPDTSYEGYTHRPVSITLAEQGQNGVYLAHNCLVAADDDDEWGDGYTLVGACGRNVDFPSLDEQRAAGCYPITKVRRNAFDGISFTDSTLLLSGVEYIAYRGFANTYASEVVAEDAKYVGPEAFYGIETDRFDNRIYLDANIVTVEPNFLEEDMAFTLKNYHGSYDDVQHDTALIERVLAPRQNCSGLITILTSDYHSRSKTAAEWISGAGGGGSGSGSGSGSGNGSGGGY